MVLTFVLGILFISGVNAKEAKEKLVWISWSSGTEAKMNEKLAEVYMSHHPKVEINLITVPWQAYTQKVYSMVVGGSQLDIAFVDSWAEYGWYKKGMMAPVDSVLEEHPELKDQSQYLWSIFDWCTHPDGHIYMIPYSGGHLPLLWINLDMFDEAGLDYPRFHPAYPWTWQEFLTAAKRLTKREGNKVTQWGFYLPYVDPLYTIWPFVLGNGGPVFNNFSEKARTWVEPTECLLDDPKSIEGLQFLYDLLHKYKVATGTLIYGEGPELWTGQKAAMELNGCWWLNSRRDTPFRYDIAPLPVKKGVKSPGIMGVNGNCVLSSSKHKEAARDFIAFFFTDEAEPILYGEPLGMMTSPRWHTYRPNGPFFSKSGLPPNIQLYTRYTSTSTALNMVVQTFWSPHSREIVDIWNSEMEKIYIGKAASAEEVCKEIVRRVNPLLKK